jgi:hypothetical protein
MSSKEYVLSLINAKSRLQPHLPDTCRLNRQIGVLSKI